MEHQQVASWEPATFSSFRTKTSPIYTTPRLVMQTNKPTTETYLRASQNCNHRQNEEKSIIPEKIYLCYLNLIKPSKSIETLILPMCSGWMYHWSFCATSATIVAGAIAERTQFVAYGVYSIVGSSVLYPVISHWIWSDTGWASRANPERSVVFHQNMER